MEDRNTIVSLLGFGKIMGVENAQDLFDFIKKDCTDGDGTLLKLSIHMRIYRKLRNSQSENPYSGSPELLYISRYPHEDKRSPKRHKRNNTYYGGIIL